MDDDRIVEFERALWIGEDDVYRRCVSDDCLMVVPEEPFVLRGSDVIETVEKTPRWSHVDISNLQINRAQDDLIVLAYRADASRGDEQFRAFCTSTYLRRGDDDWQVIQHQQTLPPTA